jgi:hypothetical protein
VTFEWNKVGTAPLSDEVEVTIFGPGFGESIILHVGDGKWILVDSCVDASDPTDRKPAAEKYLRAIGVDVASQVELVVATHWHDDHVRGLGHLLEICGGARFSCANALLKKEFLIYLEEIATGIVATDGAKISEFRHVLRLMRDGLRPPIKYAGAGRELLTWPKGTLAHKESCVLRAFSPSDQEFSLFLSNIGSLYPQPGETKRAASPQTPNLASIVLHLQFDSFAILLGADMEIHSDKFRGWIAAVDEAMDRHVDRAGVFKVAHHGSINGDYSGIWEKLLLDAPNCVVTPFNKLPLAKKLPTDADVTRLSKKSGRLLLTAPSGNATPVRTRDSTVQRSLRESGIKLQNLATRLGAVRLRRKIGSCATAWETELLGAALEIPK